MNNGALWLTLLVSYTPLVRALEGFITVPIADALCEPIKHADNAAITKMYQELPYTDDGITTCPRIHQFLFNQRVTIVKKSGNQLCVKAPVFYAQHDGSLRNEYWLLGNAVTPFKELGDAGISLDVIPQQHNTVGLVYPFYDHRQKISYSAGTRFTLAKKQRSITHTTVLVYNKQNKTVSDLLIPKKICLTPSHDSHKALQKFLYVLKAWTRCTPTVRYVLGGASLTFLSSSNDLKSGLDCSGMIWLAASLAGIPLTGKNSRAIIKQLQPLKSEDSPEQGDILWIPGHVIVLTDIKRNRVIEARGYGHGYGKVHEAPLKELFENILTYKDLIKAYNNQIPLKRLNKNKQIVQVIKEFKIVRLGSAWSSYTSQSLMCQKRSSLYSKSKRGIV